MLFLLATLRAAWRQASRDPTLTACGVGVAMLMLSALVMLAFSTENLLAALALVSGAITAARPRGDPEARRSR